MMPSIAAVIVLLLAAGLFVRFTVFSGNRIRSIRWRIRLRMHPGPGFASFPELLFRWSRWAAIHHGRRARPGLRLRHRLWRRPTDYAVRLGRSQWFRRAWSRMEDQVLVLAAQRTGKTGIVADRILDHPGPVLATSTRADLYDSTAGARALRGPVHVFNPQGVGGIPSSFSWDLLGPCKDLVMARRMASWLKVPDISGDLRWFQDKGDVALMALLWAAAVSGRTILDVYEWVQRHGHERCLQILTTHPGSTTQMFAVVKRMLEDNRTSGSIRDTIDLTLSWAVLPGLAAAVTPAPGRGFSAADFTSQCGTLYLIAAGDDDSPVTPLFRALASWVHYEAGLAGSKGPHKRLDPPLLMALDEVTQVCPVDLPVMLSDSAGKGVLITAVCHSMSQLEQRWGKHGAATVWATCGTKVLLGAISDPDTLDAASKLCGSVATADGREPVVPPELLRMLPDWRALVIRMNLSPVVVKIRPAWKRLGYRLGRHPLPVAPVPALSSLERLPESEPALAEAESAAPASAIANGHGGKPGHMVKAEP
jgi:type IV secretory pathway TraG/TraD family ATPase VirD4